MVSKESEPLTRYYQLAVFLGVQLEFLMENMESNMTLSTQCFDKGKSFVVPELGIDFHLGEQC